MKRTHALILSGAAIGLVLGSSMGIATGGTAYNAAWFFTPLGAFVGWLLALRNTAIGVNGIPDSSDPAEIVGDGDECDAEKTGLQVIVHSSLAILAAVWNFHIDILATIGLLDTFVRQPLLFLGLCIIGSVAFPPFLVVYFFAWLGANHFGITEEGKYRAAVE